MNKILEVVKAASYEMDVPEEVILGAIEAALKNVTEKSQLESVDVRVTIDPKSGDYNTFHRWTVVDENDEEIEFSPSRHITLEDAKRKDKNLKLGDVIEEPIKSIPFGRIAAQTAKQIILQKVREAKKAKIIEIFREKLGQLVSGIAKRISREGIVLDLGSGAEALIPREEMIPGAAVRSGDRIRANLYEINPEAKGYQLFASRASNEMLKALFKIEVPEIGEEIIEIKALSRDPGSRSKVAVKTNDGRIDPVGACVGMRGARVQAISNELNGERIDIILWDDNSAQLVLNAMAPAEVASIVVDEDTHTMDIAVDQSQLSQAIGRNGQNIRLASELSGWTLNVMSIEEAESKSKSESDKIKQDFMDKLDVEDDIAEILVREGFSSVEEVAYVPVKELEGIEEFDEEIVEVLRERAKEVAASRESEMQPSDDLLTMEGMDEVLAFKFAAKNIKTVEDLAELAVDDLMDIEGMTSERAGKLIMKAREPWFK